MGCTIGSKSLRDDVGVQKTIYSGAVTKANRLKFMMLSRDVHAPSSGNKTRRLVSEVELQQMFFEKSHPANFCCR